MTRSNPTTLEAGSLNAHLDFISTNLSELLRCIKTSTHSLVTIGCILGFSGGLFNTQAYGAQESFPDLNNEFAIWDSPQDASFFDLDRYFSTELRLDSIDMRNSEDINTAPGNIELSTYDNLGANSDDSADGNGGTSVFALYDCGGYHLFAVDKISSVLDSLANDLPAKLYFGSSSRRIAVYPTNQRTHKDTIVVETYPIYCNEKGCFCEERPFLLVQQNSPVHLDATYNCRLLYDR